jgi:hypothetical protein
MLPAMLVNLWHGLVIVDGCIGNWYCWGLSIVVKYSYLGSSDNNV